MNTILVFRSGAEDRTAQAVFAADLNWAQEQGINVASLSIAMLPGMKDESAGLTRFLLSGDGDVLPVTLLNGELCLAGRYPSRGELIRWSTNDFSIISGQPNTLPIVWQRLLDSNGDTCPRCRDTGDTVQKAYHRLQAILAPLGIEPRLEVVALDEVTFAAATMESNRVWFSGLPLEDWIGAQAGSSRCCGACGDSDCRTLDIGGATYEAIPESLLIRAGVIAATQLRWSDSVVASAESFCSTNNKCC
ncbi:DUF2703 domain-containing protein [Salmonella enterica subsp. enterica serovar Bovismorbificans]|nr:DUF2703 domain-containing protein [Salmonella enterica subsp. enterica serovar Bovismorbificans]